MAYGGGEGSGGRLRRRRRWVIFFLLPHRRRTVDDRAMGVRPSSPASASGTRSGAIGALLDVHHAGRVARHIAGSTDGGICKVLYECCSWLSQPCLISGTKHIISLTSDLNHFDSKSMGSIERMTLLSTKHQAPNDRSQLATLLRWCCCAVLLMMMRCTGCALAPLASLIALRYNSLKLCQEFLT